MKIEITLWVHHTFFTYVHNINTHSPRTFIAKLHEFISLFFTFPRTFFSQLIKVFFEESEKKKKKREKIRIEIGSTDFERCDSFECIYKIPTRSRGDFWNFSRTLRELFLLPHSTPPHHSPVRYLLGFYSFVERT